MNIKDKYTNDMNNIKLDPEFKNNLAVMMQQKYESSEEISEDIPVFAFPDKSDSDIQSEIIYKPKNSRIKVFGYVAAAAALFAFTFSSAAFFRKNVTEHNFTQEADFTTFTMAETVYDTTASGVSESQVTEGVISSVSMSSEAVKPVTEIVTTEKEKDITSESSSEKVTEAAVTDSPAESAEPATFSVTAPVSESEETKPEEPEITTFTTEYPDDMVIKTGVIENLEIGVLRTEKKESNLFDVYFYCSCDIDLTAISFDIIYDDTYLTVENIEVDKTDEMLYDCSTANEVHFMYFNGNFERMNFSSKILAKYTFRVNDSAPEGNYFIECASDRDDSYAAAANSVYYDGEDTTILIIDGYNTKFIPGYLEYTHETVPETETE